MQFAVFNWCNETEPVRHEIKVWHTLTPDLIHNDILALRAPFEPSIIRYLDRSLFFPDADYRFLLDVFEKFLLYLDILFSPKIV